VIRRALFATAVLTAVIIGANCSFSASVCISNKNTLFEGCYEGEVTDPASGGKLSIILDTAGQPETNVLSGCLEAQLATGREFVTLAGEVSCGNQSANLTGMLAGGQTLAIKVVRQPETGNAVTLDVTTEGGVPFASAIGLNRCSVPKPCPAMGMLVPFGSGGQP